MESTYKFGPMPAPFAQKLQTLLEEQNRTIKIYSTEELQQAVRDELKKNLGNPYPAYSGGHNALYVEIRTEDILIVKSELEKMGFPIVQKEHVGDFTPEYLCTKCSFKSDHQGLCPTHHVQLLEYSDWHEIKSKTSSLTRVIFLILILGFLAVLIYMNFAKTFFSNPLFRLGL